MDLIDAIEGVSAAVLYCKIHYVTLAFEPLNVWHVERLDVDVTRGDVENPAHLRSSAFREPETRVCRFETMVAQKLRKELLSPGFKGRT